MAGERSSVSIEDAVSFSDIRHPAATYAPTGGNRVKESHLQNIQEQIRKVASQHGYPVAINDAGRRGFDAASGKILHSLMNITPAEASNQAIWSFMGCVLLPDIVRWRFPGASSISATERFLGGSRGLRNTFGRVWWRGQVLYSSSNADPYKLLDLLGEDELVQITERPNLAGSPTLANQVCKSFLETLDSYSEITRSDLLRDAMKRLRRLTPLVSFDSLDQVVLKTVIDQVFNQSVLSLGGKLKIESTSVNLAPPPKQVKPYDPLATKIALLTPPKQFNCSKCGSPNQLLIDHNGPFTVCSNKNCGSKEFVPFEILINTLKDLKVKCEKCGSPMVPAYGGGGRTAVCINQTFCNNSTTWKHLRDVLRLQKN
jgi:DNA-directed RNA polymerase subunit RPC12/RpoP